MSFLVHFFPLGGICERNSQPSIICLPRFDTNCFLFPKLPRSVHMGALSTILSRQRYFPRRHELPALSHRIHRLGRVARFRPNRRPFGGQIRLSALHFNRFHIDLCCYDFGIVLHCGMGALSVPRFPLWTWVVIVGCLSSASDFFNYRVVAYKDTLQSLLSEPRLRAPMVPKETRPSRRSCLLWQRTRRTCHVRRRPSAAFSTRTCMGVTNHRNIRLTCRPHRRNLHSDSGPAETARTVYHPPLFQRQTIHSLFHFLFCRCVRHIYTRILHTAVCGVAGNDASTGDALRFAA